MGSLSSSKPHAVLIPYPAQGHINPFMQLAKLLNSKGFHITIVNNEHNHRRLIKSKGAEHIGKFETLRFEALPDGLPPCDRDATQDIPKLTESIKNNNMKGPFIELVQRLNCTPELPPVTYIISDVVMSFTCDAADELGIPIVQFWTASACGFLAYVHYPELVRRGIVPLKESFTTDGTLDMPIDWIPEMSNMRLKDFPSFMRVTNLDDLLFNYLIDTTTKSLHSSAILMNIFDEFEHKVLETIKNMQPNIYAAGPLNMLLRHVPETEIASFSTSLWKEDKQCLEWLDKKSPESVIYVNYGSVTIMSDQHLKEFAWGLANSKHPFLWVVRPDIVIGESGGVFPKEFYDEVSHRGLIVSWCPQTKVLKHPSIGAYLTHCGWNSITESLAGGVPLMCWPFFAEQQTNCRFACTEWGIGVEVNEDVKREELAEQVRDIMEGEKGKELRNKAKEWRRKAEVATDRGGSAYNEFERFVTEALHFHE